MGRIRVAQSLVGNGTLQVRQRKCRVHDRHQYTADAGFEMKS